MNMLCITTLALLGQTTNPTAPAGPNTGAPPPASGFLMLALVGAMMVFVLLSTRSQRKREKRERAELNDRMRKGDRVLTVGGAIGTIISVKEDEVVVKVDETTNTKMTFIKTAIQKIIGD